MSCRFGQELLEVFEEVWGGAEQCCDLTVNVLDRFGFSLICLKDVEKLFIDFGTILESILGEK